MLHPQFLIASYISLEDIHAPKHLVEDPTTSTEDENLDDGDEVHHPQDNEEEGSVIDEEVAVTSADISQNDVVTIRESTSTVQDDAPKKFSYASIVSLPYILLSCATLSFLLHSLT